MAQEGSEASVASSSPASNWWEMNINPMSSWNSMNHHRWQQQQQQHHQQAPPQSLICMNPHTHSSCEEEISISANSFTNNASNHSGLSVDSSSAASDNAAENHLWSQVLLGVDSSGEMHRSHGDGEKFLEILSSKSLATQIYDPACDYLKKLDSSWEFTSNSSSLNNIEKQLNTYNATNMIESERLTNNLSDLVTNWSIAPPSLNIDHHQVSPSGCINVSMNPNSMSYPTSQVPDIKNGFPAEFQSYFHHEMKAENQHGHEIGGGSAETSLLRNTFNISAGLGCQIGLNNSVIGLNNSGLMSDILWSSDRNLSDLISFSSLNKPAMEFRGHKTSPKGLASLESSKKAGHENFSSTKGSGRGSGTTSEGKKKRTEDSSETLFKKSKHDSSSSTSPSKLQGAKVKLGDRITALQQIVSPFGKTDTASVLLEAINYIRFLQEQVQLLSDPYFKSSANKDHSSWGSLQRKDKAEQKFDLRSRGLCLLPISCTPQAYRENNGPDYWTPPYRGCLYR